MTTITVTFDPPSPSDSPAVFNNKAFATLGDLNAWSTQANTVAGEVNTNASNAATSAGTADTAATTATTKAGEALSSANSASASAGTATTQAGIAATKAGEANASAIAAAASAATAAAMVAGPASTTDNTVARFDGATGKLIQSSAATLDDSGYLSLNRVGATAGVAVSGDATDFATGSGSVPNYGIGSLPGTSETVLSGFGGVRVYTNQIERVRIDGAGNATFSGAVAFTAGSLNVTNNIFATWKNAAGLLSAGTSGAFVGKASDNNFYIQNFEGDFVVQRAGYGVSFKIGPAGNSTFGGNLVVEGGTIGYGSGSGGTVTQVTSKSTAVTLNKPSGKFTMFNDPTNFPAQSAIPPGGSVDWLMSNNTVTINDTVIAHLDASVSGCTSNYRLAVTTGVGTIFFNLVNQSAGSLSEAVVVNFSVIKGATA